MSRAATDILQNSKQVELSLSARDLPDLEFLSCKIMVVVYVKRFGKNRKEYTRLETDENNANPDFITKINIEYRFEEQQWIEFAVYRVDMWTSTKSVYLDPLNLIGYTEVTLGKLVSQQVTRRTLKPGKRGLLIITAEELTSNNDEVELHLVAHCLENKHLFGKPNPFVIISKSTESGDYVAVHKTEVISNTLNPVWKPIVIPLRALNNGDNKRLLRFDCFDRCPSNDKHKLIGQMTISLQKLIVGPLPMTLSCINPKRKKQKAAYKDSGQFEFLHCKIRPTYTFLDFIQGGTEINATIAIDFTSSNGDPSSPTSLHYMHSGQPTLYEQAILAVGEIIEDYDTDKQIPVLGFGARLPLTGLTSHEFHVNFNPTNPYCDRIQGVVAAYRACLPYVQLSGPSNFAPCIRHVSRYAQQCQDGSNYFILLILTDGDINDMQDTKEAIVDASTLPLSIIIVGIGEADFTAMEELDSDDALLVAPSGRRAQRDIVQFVQFNKFLRSRHDATTGRFLLAQEVLREIPDQFLGFMKKRKITPKNYPPPASLVRLQSACRL